MEVGSLFENTDCAGVGEHDADDAAARVDEGRDDVGRHGTVFYSGLDFAGAGGGFFEDEARVTFAACTPGEAEARHFILLFEEIGFDCVCQSQLRVQVVLLDEQRSFQRVRLGERLFLYIQGKLLTPRWCRSS